LVQIGGRIFFSTGSDPDLFGQHHRSHIEGTKGKKRVGSELVFMKFL
jgi:hypothetical protein